jgi:general secretion pathway protein I
LSKNRTAEGFTLLEVLAALAIAGLGLGALLAATGTGLGNAKLASEYIEAARIAQSRLAAVGVAAPLTPGTTAGGAGGGYSWEVRVSPAAETEAAPGGLPRPALYGFEVVVRWTSGGGARSVSLHSQRLGPAVGGNG